jgi:hypothetical protein
MTEPMELHYLNKRHAPDNITITHNYIIQKKFLQHSLETLIIELQQYQHHQKHLELILWRLLPLCKADFQKYTMLTMLSLLHKPEMYSQQDLSLLVVYKSKMIHYFIFL